MSDRHDTPPNARGTASHHPTPGEKSHFFDDPRHVDWVLRTVYALCAVLLLADFFVERHIVHPWERLPGFYPIYGFVGIVFLVLVAKQLRKVVMRDEDYYDAV